MKAKIEKTKNCAHCDVTTLHAFRVRTQKSGKTWIFVCKDCCEKAKKTEGYQYGGTWKSR